MRAHSRRCIFGLRADHYGSREQCKCADAHARRTRTGIQGAEQQHKRRSHTAKRKEKMRARQTAMLRRQCNDRIFSQKDPLQCHTKAKKYLLYFLCICLYEAECSMFIISGCFVRECASSCCFCCALAILSSSALAAACVRHSSQFHSFYSTRQCSIVCCIPPVLSVLMRKACFVVAAPILAAQLSDMSYT